MYIYNIIYTLISILAIVSFSLKHKKKVIYLSFIILNIFLCFNYLNGIDWVGYQEQYLKIFTLSEMENNFTNYCASIPSKNKDEILFYIFMSIFKSIGLNYEMFQYTILTIIMIIMYKVIMKYSYYPIISIIPYFVYFLLGVFFEPALRQLIAIGLFYLSLDDLLKRNKKFFIKIICATLFHKSAIVLLLLWLVPRKKISIKKIIIFFCGLSFIGPYLKEIISSLIKIIPFFNDYDIYMNHGVFGTVNKLNIIYWIRLGIGIFFGYYIQSNIEELKFREKTELYLMVNLYWVDKLFFILREQFIIFSRFKFYFEIFYAITLSYFLVILLKKNGKQVRNIFLFIYLIFCNFILFKMINGWIGVDTLKFIPYTNYITEIIFNKDMKKGFEKIDYRKYEREKEKR